MMMDDVLLRRLTKNLESRSRAAEEIPPHPLRTLGGFLLLLCLLASIALVAGGLATW